MGRRRGKNRFRTQAPREGTLIVAVVLWLIGFADLILDAFTLPNNLGVWSLVLAGLLLVIGSLVDSI
jgi:hypothetical protein